MKMNVYDFQLKLLKFQEEGMRLYRLCVQYPAGFSIPGYDAWLNNLYQYEQRYLTGHRIHAQFQIAFNSAGNPRIGLAQLLQCLDIVNNDQLYWDDLKQRGLDSLEENRAVRQDQTMSGQVNSKSGSSLSTKPSVFISYNWGSDKIADEVEYRLKAIAEVRRDKSSIRPWGSITEFMKSIRKTDLVVIIISDSYLKSVACMYEVMQLMRDDDWISYTMFLVENSAKGIYKPVGQLNYVKYWIAEKENLKNELDGMDHELVTPQAEELKKIDTIQYNINDFMKTVVDRNNPDLEQAIDEVVRRVQSVSHGSIAT